TPTPPRRNARRETRLRGGRSARFPTLSVGHGTTSKVNVPSVVWVSTESACQNTLYLPGGRFGSDAFITVRSLGSSALFCRSTGAPFWSTTRKLLKAASSSWVNHTFTSPGEPRTVLPTAGLAWSRKAWGMAPGERTTLARRVSASRVAVRLVGFIDNMAITLAPVDGGCFW